MSNSENSSNNKLPSPSSPHVSGNKRTRHADFYYEDGSTVFQAGNCLYKFQASVLKADSGVEGYRFETIMNRRLGSFSISSDDLGSSDSNPIILPLDAVDFGVLLSVVFGRDKKPIISSILAAPPERALNSSISLTCHVVVGVTASYFGMQSLEFWARSRVRLILESAESVAAWGWPKNDLARILEYLQTNDMPELQHELLGFMQLVLSLAAVLPSDLSTGDRNVRLLACARLYRTRTLTTSNPSLFGFIFVTLLSLGHRSSFWTEHLTRDDRVILYAAHADLTRLSDHNDLKLDWLSKSISAEDACAANCSQNLVRGWKQTFAQCKRLDSGMPLEDINQILTLPKHRFAFAKETSNQRSQLICTCAQKFLGKIDEAMRELFCGFTRKHEALARWAMSFLPTLLVPN